MEYEPPSPPLMSSTPPPPVEPVILPDTSPGSPSNVTRSGRHIVKPARYRD
jgi:hypothetical protein